MTCEIDWSATGAMLSGWGAIGGAVAVLIAAGVARNTFDDWKKQKVTERLLDHAEKIVTSAYQAKYALQAVRSFIMWGHENERAKEQLMETAYYNSQPQQKQKRMEYAQAYRNRIREQAEVRGNLLDLMVFAKAHWDDELEQALGDLAQKFWIIQCSADEWQDTEPNEHNGDDISRMRAVFVTEAGGADSVMNLNIANAIATIERKCLPVLRIGGKAKLETL